MKKDVTVSTPAALFNGGRARDPVFDALAELRPPTKDEIISAQTVEIRRLAAELSQLHTTSGTIANATVALVHMICQHINPAHNSVTIPAELRHKLDGARIVVDIDADGDITVSYTDAPHPIFKGRALDE